MLCMEPSVVEATWQAVSAYLPPEPDPANHPLGCHRKRAPARDCFFGLLVRLVTGCSFEVAGRLTGTSETTLRRRRDEWVEAGVFDKLFDEALRAYDRVIGLHPEEISVDSSVHKAPCGGESTGKSPVDRAKLGWKWSVAVDAYGIPLGVTHDVAARSDTRLLYPTLAAVEQHGLLGEIRLIHLDRGYDFANIDRLLAQLGCEIDRPAKRKRGQKKPVRTHPPLGDRWRVEAANSWLSNYGQLRRNTDRKSAHRAAALVLVCALVIIVKLVKYQRRWCQ